MSTNANSATVGGSSGGGTPPPLATGDLTKDTISKLRPFTLAPLCVNTTILEVEMTNCRQRLISGEIGFASATSGSIKKCGHKSTKDMATSPFIMAFTNDLDRLTRVLSELRTSAENSACKLLTTANELPNDNAQSAAPGSAKSIVQSAKNLNIKNEAISLQGRMLQLKQVTRQNATELHRISSLADSQLGTDTNSEMERYLSKEPWVDNGSVVILLSDIFSILRNIEESKKKKKNGKDGDKKWVAPSSFERVTTKFWVTEDNLSEVLLKSVTDLPLLVYGRSGLLQKDITNPSTEDLWSELASPISSVYFDSANMDLYNERIKRSEGAKLFRVRWYGNKPKGNKPIFLELKTHHECWVDNKSVKERVALLEKDMSTLLDITTGKWTSEYANKLVRKASPKDTDESIREAAALLLEIRDLIVKFKLRPCVRTKYTRAAFQSASNNNLRLTIDKDITVIDETRTTGESWCLEDDSMVPMDAIVKVPYGVFEVKVGQGTDPLFITELENSGAIVKANKFSKFLTGAAIHNNKAVNMLPWWADDLNFAPLFAPPSNAATSYVSPPTEGIRLTRGSDPSDSDLSDDDEDEQLLAAEEGKPVIPDIGSSMRSTKSSRIVKRLSIKQPAKDLDSSGRFRRLDLSFRHQRSSHPRQLSEVESRYTSSTKASSVIGGTASKLDESTRSMSSRMSRRFSYNKNTVEKNDPHIAPRSPARVEPKSFFANERTFIQWIGAAMAIVLVAQLIFTTAHAEQSKEALMAGNWMMATALLVALYGMGVYYRRMYLMTASKPYGYADGIGPAVFTVFTIVGIALIIYWSNATFEPHNPALVEEEGVCVKRHLGGDIAMIEFEPSDILVDESRGELLVVSNNEIVALPDGIPLTEEENDVDVKLVYRFPGGGEDLEALEIIGDEIFAVSEKNKRSELITLQRQNEDDGTLAETTRYVIPTPGTEGLTFIPDNTNWFSSKEGRLVAAGVKTSKGMNVLSIDSFSVPFPNDEMNDVWFGRPQVNEEPWSEKDLTRLPNIKLNDKIFSGTLIDPKVSAMSYFDGLLYVLFDNAQVIRSFDHNGNMIQETKLPVAAVGYEKQWEGMRLQRKDGDLILHLALDSPPQLWSIKLDENEMANGWELPSCAS